VTIYKPVAVNSSTGLLCISGSNDDPRPKLDNMIAAIAVNTNVQACTFDQDNAIRVRTKERPTTVKLWKATNPNNRNLSIGICGPNLSQRSAGTGESRRVCWKGPRSLKKADGILRRLDLPKRREISVQVHDRNSYSS
jgi:predicted nuclease of predicted toxin-antitoxin system